MIEFTEAIAFNQAKREHMLAQFGDALIEKAVSTEEFGAQYEGHEVFTVAGLNSYVSAKVEGVEDTEKEDILKSIATEFEGLSPVLVRGGSPEAPKLTKVFVRKAAETSETEEDTED